MDKKITGLDMRNIGNFTKNAVENFEENIVNKHNYLEEVNANLKNKKDDNEIT